ncbi:hypothetical protein BU15DRAFT_72157 [Melanogaster broomeanus]|nr:hypothetical protein BU15DRAFT_72157 [Melanogaster broomeanus]
MFLILVGLVSSVAGVPAREVDELGTILPRGTGDVSEFLERGDDIEFRRKFTPSRVRAPQAESSPAPSSSPGALFEGSVHQELGW